MKNVSTLLLVDDDADEMEIFQEAINALDSALQLVYIPSAAQALSLLTAKSIIPDIIFLDLNMPGMTGKECLLQLRKLKYLDDTPVIIYSTSQNQNEVDEVLKFGASLFLTKPGDFKTLYTELKLILCL